jgi:hypothetical protein
MSRGGNGSKEHPRKFLENRNNDEPDTERLERPHAVVSPRLQRHQIDSSKVSVRLQRLQVDFGKVSVRS